MASNSYKIYVYKIVNEVNNMIYIGSTSQSLSKRFSEHKYDCNRGSQLKIHQYMRQIGIEHFKIYELSSGYVNSQSDMLKMEQLQINRFKKDELLNESHVDSNSISAIYKKTYRANNPLYVEEQRIKNREKMRLKRALNKKIKNTKLTLKEEVKLEVTRQLKNIKITLKNQNNLNN